MSKTKYFLKKFLSYLIYAITALAYVYFIFPFAVVFGGIPIIITALSVSAADCLRLQEGDSPIVFDKAFKVAWFGEVLAVMITNLLYHLI